MVEKLVPVPDDGLPPVAVQANVYGDVPPVAEAVQETGVPTVPVDGQVMLATSGRAAMVTVADFVLVFAGDAESVPVTDIVLLPLVEYVVLKLLPVPLPGLPPVAVHENVTGGVPPVDDAVQETAVPTVPVEGQVIVTTSEGAVIVTVADLVEVAEFVSVAVTDMVKVPAVLYVVLKLDPVPEAGLPPVAVHANV